MVEREFTAGDVESLVHYEMLSKRASEFLTGAMSLPKVPLRFCLLLAPIYPPVALTGLFLSRKRNSRSFRKALMRPPKPPVGLTGHGVDCGKGSVGASTHPRVLKISEEPPSAAEKKRNSISGS